MIEQKNEKTTSKIEKNLERLYKTIFEQENTLEFFKGIHSYVEYVLETPIFKAVVDKQMTERAERYAKLDETEAKSVKEMLISKNKILAIIKNKKIDTNNFERHSTFSHEPFTNIVLELEAFERGEIIQGKFHSNSYETYLFDIASNLQKMGYGKELGNMAVSQKEYADYYNRINGHTNGYWFAGNENGSFIFSQTWPERFEQEDLLKRERSLKNWGAFEKNIQFKCAYDAVMANISFWHITENSSPYSNFFNVEDSVDIGFMAEDLYHLMGQTRYDSPRKVRSDQLHSSPLDRLNVVAFKAIMQTVHNLLMKTIEFYDIEEPKKIESGKKRKGIYLDNDNLCFNEKKIPVERGQKSMVELFIKNAEIHHNNKLTQKGAGVEVLELQKVGGYQNESAYRNALNKLRKKLKDSEFPATIENPQTKKYQIVIKYQ